MGSEHSSPRPTACGFRARRGWDMTSLLPELETIPTGLILDGELFVACNIAKDAIPDLPAEIARVVEEPVRRVCDIVGSEVEKVRPDLIAPSYVT
jgi:hypothetical protein